MEGTNNKGGFFLFVMDVCHITIIKYHAYCAVRNTLNNIEQQYRIQIGLWGDDDKTDTKVQI